MHTEIQESPLFSKQITFTWLSHIAKLKSVQTFQETS